MSKISQCGSKPQPQLQRRPPGYSPTTPTHVPRPQGLPSPDVKDRTAPPAVPFIASPEPDRGCPAPSRLLDVGEDGAWPFPEGRERERARRFFSFGGWFRGVVRASPAHRTLAQFPVRARCARRSVASRVWLYVAREWRQNSN